MTLEDPTTAFWWFLAVCLSFTPHVTLAASLLLGPALIQRHWGVAALLAVAVIAGAVLLVRSERHLARARACEGPTLRVTTFNVHTTNEDPRAVPAVVAARQPDVLVLQELTAAQAQRLDALRETYPFQLSSSPPAVAVLSRVPFEAARVVPVPATPGARGILEVALDLEGTTVAVYALHALGPNLPARARMQKRQFEHLRALLASRAGPAIVAGDLNSTVFAPPLARLLDDGGLQTAISGRREAPTWPNWAGPLGVRIDHVLVRGFEVCAAAVGPAAHSDHRAVTADVRLASPAPGVEAP